MPVYSSLQQLVGATPLLELKGIQKELNLNARILAKLECFNPGGSVKDRVALQMILSAREKGLLPEGGTIIEPTSGNTGIGLCAIGGESDRWNQRFIPTPNASRAGAPWWQPRA